MWLMQQLSVASSGALIRCRSRVAHSQHSTSLAWRLLPTLLTIKSVVGERREHMNLQDCGPLLRASSTRQLSLEISQFLRIAMPE